MNKFSVVYQFSRSLPCCLASVAALCVLVLAGMTTAPMPAQDFPAVGRAPRTTLALPGLKAPVGVYRDTFGIPHIYATSSEDACFALGYLHATDRLFEMEVSRRRASGTLAEIFGKASLEDDIFVRQIGIRRTAEATWKSPRLDGRIRSELEAYCAGVNARLGELQKLSGAKLPVVFQQLGFTPAPWTPVDALAFPKYMGWDQSGTDTDVWMGMLVQKLGLETVNELFPLDRPYEIPTIPEWGAANKPLGHGRDLAGCGGVKQQTGDIILSPPCFSADEGSPRLGVRRLDAALEQPWREGQRGRRREKAPGPVGGGRKASERRRQAPALQGASGTTIFVAARNPALRSCRSQSRIPLRRLTDRNDMVG